MNGSSLASSAGMAASERSRGHRLSAHATPQEMTATVHQYPIGIPGEFTMDDVRPPDGHEPVTTIAWRLAHLIDVFGSPSAAHFGVPPAGHPAISYSGTADGALRQLDDGHDGWVRDVRALGTAGLARPQGALSPPQFAAAPVARLILYINLEVIHHGAEICLLRDLYLRKDSRDDLRVRPGGP